MSHYHLRIYASLTTYVHTHLRLKLERESTIINSRQSANYMKRSFPKSKRAVTNRLWRYRKAQQLTQKQVAQLLGHKSIAQVSRWENGAKTPTLDNALMLGHISKMRS